MPATPAGPTLTGETDPAGDPIVLTGSGLPLTIAHLTVLDAATRARTSNYRADITYNNSPDAVRELQRDHMLSTDEAPFITEYGFLALEMAGWV